MSEVQVGSVVPLASREVRVYLLSTGDRDLVRAASRHILAALLDTSIDALRFDYSEQGKPSLHNDASLHYSTSHSADASLIAVTRVAPVGVDIEKIRAVPNAEVILRRFFPPDEMARVLATPHDVNERFMAAWTRGEASVKVRGGSVWEMATRDSTVSVRNIDVPAGYAGAVGVAVSHDDWDVTRFVFPVDGGVR
jgi:4'-phosphopantetheinyl transferase